MRTLRHRDIIKMPSHTASKSWRLDSSPGSLRALLLCALLLPNVCTGGISSTDDCSIEHLCSDCWMLCVVLSASHMIELILAVTLWGRYCCYSHLMGELTEARRGSDLPWITQLITDKAMVCMQAEWCQSPCSEPLSQLPFDIGLLRDSLNFPLPLESKSQEVSGFPFSHLGQSSQISSCIPKPPPKIALFFSFLSGSIISPHLLIDFFSPFFLLFSFLRGKTFCRLLSL